MNKQSQEQVWNKIAEPWTRFRKKAPDEVEEFLRGKKGKILDLGCGSGRNLIVNPNMEYYGVDFSEEMLKFSEERAKELGVRAVFFKADIGREELPFPSDFFDCAVFISALHCIETAKARKNALKEMHRVLKKGGEALITAWNKESNEEFKNMKAKEGFVNWKKDGANFQRYYYFYEKNELIEELKSAGFSVAKREPEHPGGHSKRNFLFYLKK